MEASWRAEATNLQDLRHHHGQSLLLSPLPRVVEIWLALRYAVLGLGWAVLCGIVDIQDQVVALQALVQGREIDAIWGRSHGRKAQQAMRKGL